MMTMLWHSVSTEDAGLAVTAVGALCAAAVAHRRAHSPLARYHPTLAATEALLCATALCGVALLLRRTTGPARDLLQYGVLYGAGGGAALLAAARDSPSLRTALGLAAPTSTPRLRRAFLAALGTGLAVAAVLLALALAPASSFLSSVPLSTPTVQEALAATPMVLVQVTFAQLVFGTCVHRALLAAFGALPAALATGALHAALRVCLCPRTPGLGTAVRTVLAAVAQHAYASVFLAAPRTRFCAAWAAWPAVPVAAAALEARLFPAAPTTLALSTLAAAAPHAITVLVVWVAVALLLF